MCSHTLLFSGGFNVFDAVQLSLPGAGTGLTGFFPVSPRLDIRAPEGPRATLSGAGFVDQTAASLGIEKDAIAIGVFDQARSTTDTADELSAKRVFVHFHRASQGQYFVAIDPYETRFTRTTTTTLRTFKL